MNTPTLGKLSSLEKDILLNALKNESSELNRSCAYTQTTKQPKEDDRDVYVTTVSRFDPQSNPEAPWQLLSIDNRPPTTQQSRNFESKQRGHPATTISNFDNPIVDLMKLRSKDDGYWVFQGPAHGFGLDMEGQIKRLEKNLSLEIVVHESSSTLNSVKMVLEKPYKVFLVGKISKFQFEITFGTDPDVKGLVATKFILDMNFSAFGRRMSVALENSYSDFDCSQRLSVSR